MNIAAKPLTPGRPFGDMEPGAQTHAALPQLELQRLAAV